MKILDRYLLKLFTSTFLTVFVILFFIFILQTVWLFISELAGKDLDFISVIKFLLFATPRVVPLVLPLSVLLASIMTFGSLAENYEFAAMKSSGISLKRAMNSLIVFIFFLSIIAFFFANNVIPYAEYKFINFRRNIAQVKPAMAIAEGQFSDIGNYTIKVEKKSGFEGRFLDKVTIHKKGNFGSGNNSIIKAETGEIVSSKESNNLQLVLRNGNYYEDIIPKKFEERNKVPFAKSEFKKYVINIDLSKFNQTETEDDEITNTNTMLTIGELKYTIDSLSKGYTSDLKSFVENINDRTVLPNTNYTPDVFVSAIDTTKTTTLENKNIISNYTTSEKQQIYKVALSSIESTNFSLESSLYEFENKVKNINSHWIAFFEKFVIAFSCILMFFIGAPLGAIIRKGGLGLPIVFAVLIFIIYHFINTFGKKLAQENGITPFLGTWMATLILLPFAVFLTKRATDDKGVMSISLFPFTDWIEKLFTKKEQTEQNVLVSINIPEVPTDKNDSIESFENVKSNEKIVSVLKEMKHESLDLKIYHRYSEIALISNLSLLLLFFFKINNVILLISFFTVLLFCVVKLQLTLIKSLRTNQLSKPIFTIITVITAFPFYFIFYIYYKITLKELLKNKSS